jgi:hypothetical protein
MKTIRLSISVLRARPKEIDNFINEFITAIIEKLVIDTIEFVYFTVLEVTFKSDKCGT